ncbi:hypothetical protein JCM10908_006394 [Rhodotorula pacifica]|uniref:uncharacterized protein n=1 Tax=Rhodotorula pacifica TaxID=1495444 RepID=UPI00317C47B2
MSSANLRLAEPVVFLVGGLDYERARQRQRRAAARAANQAATGEAGIASPSPGPSRQASPERGTSGTRAASLSRSRPASRAPSVPGSRAASPAPRGRLAHFAEDFIPPNSRGRSHSRTRPPVAAAVPTPPSAAAATPNAGPSASHTESLSRGRSGSLVREMTDAQIRLQQEQEHAALDEPPPAMLRGILSVHLSKPTRIKEITVRFKGIARTDWPEGIGPRRLDVMEENMLINYNHTFFSASASEMNRRAASIGPGSGDHSDEGRGRASRRAASVAPGRDISHGRSYHARDGVLSMPASAATNAARSSTSLGVNDSPRTSRLAIDENGSRSDAPPIQPGEAAPSYEVAVESPIGSPLHGASPHNLSVDTFDLGSPLLRASRHNLLDRSSTPPSGSPLAAQPPVLSHASSNSDLQRVSTRASRLSHDSTSTISSQSSGQTNRPSFARQTSSNTANSTANSNSDVEQSGPGWNSAPVPGSTTSSFERGRLPVRDVSLDSAGSEDATGEPGSLATVSNGVAGMTFQSRTSVSRQVNSPGSPTESRRRLSNSSQQTARRASLDTRPTPPPAPPSAMKSGSGRSVSRGPRFLSGISEVLRGKSSSRARGDVAHEATSNGRRNASPDARSEGSRVRSQSRGRKTALKALREALVVGHLGSSHGNERDGSDEDGHNSSDVLAAGDGWKEFKAGTYTYPISIPVAASLPPSLNCEFGHVTYTLKATVHRAGALTPKLTSSTEVLLVTSPSEEDTEENESIVVERFWETQVKYHVALSGKSFPIGGQIPISIRLNPLAKIKLYRITAQLEQKTSYFASVHSGRKLTRHETPKRFQLLRIENKDPKEPLLPILSDDPNVLASHPLREFFINASSSDDETPSLLDPIGPWHLDGVLQLPDCSNKLNVTTNHDKANISIAHTLKIMMRVERGDDEYLDSKGNRKLWDIVVEAGVVMLSCRLSQNILPAYTDATASVSAPSGSRSSRNATTRTATHTCGNNNDPSRASHLHLVPHSTNANRATAPLATLEDTLLFSRLISGETTPAGETPPTYDAVIDGTAPQGRPPSVVIEEEEERRGRTRDSSVRRSARD